MGKIKQGILGGFSGKVGNVIGGSWKGIATLRVMPISVANPRTAPQIAQRTKFSNTVAVAVILLASVVKPLWDRFASKMSGFNDFVKTNIDLFATAAPDPPQEFEISHGKMAKTTIHSVDCVAGTAEADTNWINDSGSGYKLASDIAFVVIYNETQDVWGFSTTGQGRDQEAQGTPLPTTLLANDVLRIWLAFQRTDGTVVSMTSYDTISVPAA